MGATGDLLGAVGDTCVVHMDREALNDYPMGLYDVTVKIVTFDPDREIAWTIEGQLNLGHVYGYKLEPMEGGTLATSYYDWSSVEQNWKTRISSRSFRREPSCHAGHPGPNRRPGAAPTLSRGRELSRTA